MSGKAKFCSILGCATLIILFGGTNMSKAVKDIKESFNPNFIIGNQEVLDNTTMSQQDIQNFLKEKGSYLAEYTCENPDTGEKMSAAEAIYDRSQENKVNPQFLLVLLQKEQGLITDPDPEEGRLDWATGYGCPDGGGCNDYWEGFWKQINSASLQFRDYIENPQDYNYQKGKPYTLTNPNHDGDEKTTIIPANKATAGLYNYTPHVYNGNYNFYRFWNEYFTKSYPDGSLLSAKDEPGIWLIDDGEKRPFHTKTALTSRFDPEKVVEVKSSTLASYPKGAPVKFPNYSLVRSPKGNIYLLVDDKKREIASDKAFRTIGFHPGEVMNASWRDLRSYEDSKPVTATSTYPTGALLQNTKTGGIYWVYEGVRSPLLGKVFLNTKFSNKKITPASSKELAKYEKGEPVKFDNGQLLTHPKDPAVYLIADGKKRPFVSGQAFTELGYKWKNVITAPARILELYKKGDPITEKGLN